MNNLPPEILEKIIIEGDFLNVFKVCQKWYDIAQKKRFKFNDVVFDLYKDNPENVKKQLNIINIHYSQIHNFEIFFKKKYVKLLNNVTSLNALNIILDPLIYTVPNMYHNIPIFKLSKNVISENKKSIVGVINYQLHDIIDFVFLNSFTTLNKIVHIKIKDYCNRIDEKEKIEGYIFFINEIEILQRIIKLKRYLMFSKFSFTAPNDTYLIYDRNKKLLIIRFGHYERYNLVHESINICHCFENSCLLRFMNHSHKIYTLNCFYSKNLNPSIHNQKIYCYSYYGLPIIYPAILISINYEFILRFGTIENLIIISNDFYEFIFDDLLKVSNNLDINVKYFSLDRNKTKKIKQNKFEFIPVEEKDQQNFTFKNMYQ